MNGSRSLRRVLLAGHGLVILVVAAVGFLVVRLLTPSVFESRLRGAGFRWGETVGGSAGRGRGPAVDAAGQMASQEVVDAALGRSLTIAAAVAALIGLVVAVPLALYLVRLLLDRFASVEAATARLAAGDHSARVPIPPERELADLAGSINSLGESLERTERNRARLISDLAHELRNPLTTIQGSMEGLIDGVLPASPETYASVAEEVDRLRRLTGDLSLLARGQEGALDLHLEPVDLVELCRRTVERLRPQFDSKGVAVSMGSEPAPVMATVDSERMGQVLLNVVGNALTHTPSGGFVTIALGGMPSAAPTNLAMPTITVTDSGSGIPADQLESVFDRYTRLDPQTPGTGIGLTIARSIVTAHGGTITAHSDGPGTGSRFTISVPAGSAAGG